MHDDAGVHTGFEVSNLFLSRGRICRLAARIDGAQVIRRPRRFALNDDDFGELVIGGEGFIIIEPFGDSTVYWIVAKEPPASSEAMSHVRSALLNAPTIALF
jgi:hypothetical protein